RQPGAALQRSGLPRSDVARRGADRVVAAEVAPLRRRPCLRPAALGKRVQEHENACVGGLAEWLKALVLKTSRGSRPSRGRIPGPPPLSLDQPVGPAGQRSPRSNATSLNPSLACSRLGNFGLRGSFRSETFQKAVFVWGKTVLFNCLHLYIDGLINRGLLSNGCRCSSCCGDFRCVSLACAWLACCWHVPEPPGLTATRGGGC